MPAIPPAALYRFGIFELDTASGELRRAGMRVKLHSQPFQVLTLLLRRPGEMLTREEICRELWPDGTFVDYEHGVNSAINRLRDALGDKASNPRFVETLARRGYRFLAPVEKIGPVQGPPEVSVMTEMTEIRPAGLHAEPPDASEIALERVPAAGAQPESGFLGKVLATPEDLPESPHRVVQTLFVLLQLMYVGFYVGALTN